MADYGTRSCEQCGAAYIARKKWQKFCLTKCRHEANSEKERKEVVKAYLSEIGRKGGFAKHKKHGVGLKDPKTGRFARAV